MKTMASLRRIKYERMDSLHVYHRLLFNIWVNHVWVLLVRDGCGNHRDLCHVHGTVINVVVVCLTSTLGDHSSNKIMDPGF